MSFDTEEKYYRCCGSEFFIHIIEVILFVVFAGLMNGLTLGYMSMNRVDLEVLVKSGLPKHRRFASKILTIIKRRHLFLCTLVISKAFAAEALPIFIHQLIPEIATILISTALILIFTEIIPHSVCSRFGLVIGFAMAPAIHVLVWICFPVAYPISKLLDFIQGRGRVALYRQAELKTLVDLHANEAGKGGDLSCHEVSIIKSALEITEKTARDAMIPNSDVFSVDINANLDRVPETMPLVQLLKEFQRGLSHMAVVTRPRTRTGTRPSANREEVRLEIYGESIPPLKRSFKRSMRTTKVFPGNENVSRMENSRSKRWSGESHPEILNLSDNPLLKLPKEEEVLGIITMGDVIEEILEDDIYDEMDHLEQVFVSSPKEFVNLAAANSVIE